MLHLLKDVVEFLLTQDLIHPFEFCVFHCIRLVHALLDSPGVCKIHAWSSEWSLPCSWPFTGCLPQSSRAIFETYIKSRHSSLQSSSMASHLRVKSEVFNGASTSRRHLAFGRLYGHTSYHFPPDIPCCSLHAGCLRTFVLAAPFAGMLSSTYPRI